jgi:molecular chaperone DnaK
VDLREGFPVAYSRLWWAAEEAKKRLSNEPFTMIREESLATVSGRQLHLEFELSRRDYESMIRPLVESTLEKVTQALSDAQKTPREIDAVLLVGGSTRTPLIYEILTERMSRTPQQDIHPDLCVALGAGVLASRLEGREVDRILVDISPYTFGTSYLGTRGGRPYVYCYKPIIRRGTPLPVARSEMFYTLTPDQKVVDVKIYQGEDEDALKNILVGDFKLEGLTPTGTNECNEVLCRMSLDLDGVLDVASIEKRTGKSKKITIINAMRTYTEEDIAAARKRLEDLWAREASEDYLPHGEDVPEDVLEDVLEEEQGIIGGSEPPPLEVTPKKVPEGWAEAVREALKLLERCRTALPDMHDEDKEEAVVFNEAIEEAMVKQDIDRLRENVDGLREMLFFVEGK